MKIYCYSINTEEIAYMRVLKGKYLFAEEKE
jgi:hypothetical protein